MSPVKKHIPLRTCVICGAKSPKRELLRIVATPSDGVGVDDTGRLAGRGTYVCGGVQCASGRVKKGSVERALRHRISEEEWEAIAAAIAARGTEHSRPEPCTLD